MQEKVKGNGRGYMTDIIFKRGLRVTVVAVGTDIIYKRMLRVTVVIQENVKGNGRYTREC